MAKKFRINLLIKKERFVLQEAVTFLNSYAKYVIVLTQITVLLVFFVKIILDQTVIDLKETIDQKNQIILTAQEMINNNNLMANKLKEVSQILEINDYRYQTLKKVLVNAPKSVKYSQLTMQDNKVMIEGTSNNPLDIQKLQLRLQQSLKGKVTVNQISKDTETYLFKLSIIHEEPVS